MLLGLSALAALAAGPAVAEPAIRAEYRCLGRFDASDVTALFFNANPAEVVLIEGEQGLRLPRQLAASGSRYSDGRDTFWIKGDDATWSRERGPARRCSVRR